MGLLLMQVGGLGPARSVSLLEVDRSKCSLHQCRPGVRASPPTCDLRQSPNQAQKAGRWSLPLSHPRSVTCQGQMGAQAGSWFGQCGVYGTGVSCGGSSRLRAGRMVGTGRAASTPWALRGSSPSSPFLARRPWARDRPLERFPSVKAGTILTGGLPWGPGSLAPSVFSQNSQRQKQQESGEEQRASPPMPPPLTDTPCPPDA